VENLGKDIRWEIVGFIYDQHDGTSASSLLGREPGQCQKYLSIGLYYKTQIKIQIRSECLEVPAQGDAGISYERTWNVGPERIA
jgi:hypothetical protein